MKKINFTGTGGFPLEQETLARLQTAYRDELYEMLKRNFGIQEDQNYIISEPTSDENGLFVINGILHLMKPGVVTPTGFIRTTETTIGLRFGDGIYNAAYTDYFVEYVDTVLNGYDLNDPILERDGVIDPTISAPNERRIRFYDIRNNSSNRFQSIGFLPIDGSKPMEGDLDMGGNQLSNLDTLSSEFAILRSKFLLLGDPNDTDGLGFPGAALVDKDINEFIAIDARPVNPDNTALHLNYDSVWGTTVIGGEINLPEFAENSTSTRKAPLLIDNRGNVCKGSASENIPLGLISLWYDTNNPIPPGWRLCDEDNAGQVGSITIPDLDDNTINIADSVVMINQNRVRYIIYVGRDTPSINAVISSDAGDRKSVIRTLTGGQTSFDATANPFTLNVTLENLTLQGWRQLSAPNNSTITTPGAVTTTITGNLIVGTYVYEVTGIDTLGAEFTDTVSIEIRRNNIAPVFNSIVNTTSGVNVTDDMDIEITSALVLANNLSRLAAPTEVANDMIIQDQLDGNLVRMSNQLVLRRTNFRVGVSDPDGNIFSSSVSVIARVRRANGSVETVQSLLLLDDINRLSVSSADTTIVDVNQLAINQRFFDFSILGLVGTDILEFVVTDEDGAETVKTYNLVVTIEPSITISQEGPFPTFIGKTGRFFDVRIQGTPNTTVSLIAERLLSNAINGEITVSNTGTIPATFDLTTLNRAFDVILDSNGVRVIRVLHEMTVPPLTSINNGTTYTLNSRITLASNPVSNGVNLRFAFILTGDIIIEGPIDIVPIDDTPIDVIPMDDTPILNGGGSTGGGGGGGDVIIADESGNDFPPNQF